MWSVIQYSNNIDQFVTIWYTGLRLNTAHIQFLFDMDWSFILQVKLPRGDLKEHLFAYF